MIEMNQLTLTNYQDIKQEIRNNMQDIVVSFVEIGYYLKQIRDKEMYREDGYNTIWEFAAGEYKLDRTAASRFMSINDKYSVNGNSPELLEQYQGFGKSTLTEMLSLPVEDYELIKADTKIEDIRELKAAEREYEEEKQSQIEGQESLMSIMPDVVPESEKSKKEEVTIATVLRELFKPREMKERLNSLVNMDPESDEMRWWVADFNQTGNFVYKRAPFFIFFYGLEEGLKIKNLKEGVLKPHTYREFYFMVRGAFGKETVRGTDVWTEAFGAEYEAEQQKIKEEEAQKKAEEQRKKELQKQRDERQRAIKENQGKSAVKESQTEVSEQKEENAATLKEINENSDSDYGKESIDNSNVEIETEKAEIETEKAEIETETPEIVTGTVEQEEEESVCDIAQNDEVRIITTLERLEQYEREGIEGTQHFSVEVGEETYSNIVNGFKRFITLGYKVREGNILSIRAEDKPSIEAMVLCYEYFPEGKGYNICGFEVMGFGQEE